MKSIDFEAIKRMVTVPGDRKGKRFQFSVIIILLQATLFCGGTKAVLYPHCTRYVMFLRVLQTRLCFEAATATAATIVIIKAFIDSL